MKKLWIVLMVCILICVGILLWKQIAPGHSNLSMDDNSLPKVASGATPFSDSDLVIGSLSYGASRSDVIRVFGNPKEEKDSLKNANENFIYGRYITYTYENGLVLTFYNFGRGEMLLGSVYCPVDSYEFTRNIKIGDKKEDIIQAFYHEKQMRDYVVNGKVQGKFLYGDALQSQLFNTRITDFYSYGFINTYASTQYESTIEYVSLKPPFIGPYATSQDAYSRIVFHFDLNTLSAVSWEYCPATTTAEN